MAGRDDDERDVTMSSLVEPRIDPRKELEAIADELVELLKRGDVAGALADQGINASLALLAVDALRSYMNGDKARAAEDFTTVGEEIAARLALAASNDREPPN